MRKTVKKLLFTLIITTVFPVLILLVLELVLRAAGTGYQTTPLVEIQSSGEKVWVGNPDFTRLYFPDSLKRLPPPNRIPVNKGTHTRRYMMVGGSAAAGDPNTDFSIARILAWMLAETHPESRFELINLAYTACNSHVSLEVVRQADAYDLDGIIVLVGNNEVIGPFGAGRASLATRDRQVALRKTKLGQLGQFVREDLLTKEADRQTWRGMQQFLHHRVRESDPELEKIYANFQTNLKAIEQEASTMGIPCLLAPVPVNLLDQPPFYNDLADLPDELAQPAVAYLESGKFPIELETLEQSMELYPDSAYLNYILGRILFSMGMKEQAGPYLRRACDLDQLRFRADSRINSIIRDQWKRKNTSCLPVETEAALIADSPNGALGFPHFYEHVHLSFRANFLIAREMAKVLLESDNLDTSTLDKMEWWQAAQGLAYTPYEAWVILEEMDNRFQQAPFTGIPGYQQLTAWMDTLRQSLFTRISKAEEKARMHETYLRAIQTRPEDDILKISLAAFLDSFGRTEEAFAIVEDVYPSNPTNSKLVVNFLTLSLKLGRITEAEQALARMQTIFPKHPNIEKFRSELEQLKKD